MLKKNRRADKQQKITGVIVENQEQKICDEINGNQEKIKHSATRKTTYIIEYTKQQAEATLTGLMTLIQWHNNAAKKCL